MSNSFDRRTVLKGAAVTAVAMGSIGEGEAAFPDGLGFSEPVAFSYDLLKASAREKAHAPYIAPPHPAPEVVQKIDYEEWGKIRYRPDHALFADGPGPFPKMFFHLGLFFQNVVDFYVIEGDHSKKIIYDQSYFDMPADSVLGNCRKAPASQDFASRNRATAGSIGERTTGSPSSARPIFERSASCANTACRRAASRWTSRSPADRKNSPISRSSTSTRRRARIRSSSTR